MSETFPDPGPEQDFPDEDLPPDQDLPGGIEPPDRDDDGEAERELDVEPDAGSI